MAVEKADDSTSIEGEYAEKRLGKSLVPPAVTPLTWQDLYAGVRGHLKGTGRDEFRSKVRTYLHGDAAATYTSYRRALTACLWALDRDAPGDASLVAVPAFCSSDYEAAIEAANLEMHRYDVDPHTLAADFDALEQLPTEDVLAVVIVNVLGYSHPMDDLQDFCEQEACYLIEALGYGLGGRYKGAPLGTFGDCSVLNFQQGKPIPVGGGMVVANRPTLPLDDHGRKPVSPNPGLLTGYKLCSHPSVYYWYAKVRQHLADLALDGDRLTTHPGSKDGVTFDPPFQTLSNFQGAVASELLARLEDDRRARARTAIQYRSAFQHVDGVRSIDPVAGITVQQYVRYPLQVGSPELRDRLQQALRDVGIEAPRLYDWPPLDAADYPGACQIQNEILTLPTHPLLNEDERTRVIRTVRAVCEGETDP